LAFGSIAGSGILSLPSAVYAEAGASSLIVWLVAALMCVPMLLMFHDAMKLSGDGDALRTLVARGTRPWVGAAMPLMFLLVVVIGLPTGCMVAGRYVERGLGWSGGGPMVAATLLALSLAANVAGGKASKAVQLVGSAALVATGIALIIAGVGHATHPLVLGPRGDLLDVLLPGALLAFWAFVGFENLTFLSRDLREPDRDFLPVSLAALALYGAFVIALTMTIAVCVRQQDVDPLAGLLQLSDSSVMRAVVVAVAVTAMLINSAAWVRGVSQLMVNSARDGYLPAVMQRSQVIRTALLAVLFATTLTTLALAPELTVDALAASSAVFVLIYLICIVSYLRTFGLTVRTSLNALLIPVMAATLVQSGSRSAYGMIVAIGCLCWCRFKSSTEEAATSTRSETAESSRQPMLRA
jgi:amino acid efflux transporter